MSVVRISICTLMLFLTPFHCSAQQCHPMPEADKKNWWLLNLADAVFTAQSANIKWLMTLDSFPSVDVGTVVFNETQQLRKGKIPEKLNYSYSEVWYQGTPKPVPPDNMVKNPTGAVIAAIRTDARSNGRVTLLLPLSAEIKATATKATKLPLGWYEQKGELRSAWALQPGCIAPPAPEPGLSTCSITKRPALMTGEGLSMRARRLGPDTQKSELAGATHVTNAPPSKIPAGVAAFEITVTNETDTEKSIPALLRSSEGILWSDSIFLIRENDGMFCFFPASKVESATVRPVRLGPHESVKGILDASIFGTPAGFGANTITYRFCLGEKSALGEVFYSVPARSK